MALTTRIRHPLAIGVLSFVTTAALLMMQPGGFA